MATKVILPMLGETMEEGTITKWLKQEGDQVEKGEPLLEVMTDKVNIEVESPASGTLRKITAQEEQTVPVMELIGIIGAPDESIDEFLAEAGPPEKPTPEVAEKPIAATGEIPPPEPSGLVTGIPPSPPSRVFISPRARRLAHEHGIAIEALAGVGTGPNGRIVERDVRQHIAEAGEVKVTPLAARVAADRGINVRQLLGTGPHGKVTRADVLDTSTAAQAVPMLEGKTIPFTGMRKMVADNVARSAQTAPHVTLVAEVDMTEAVDLRKEVLAEFEQKYGTRLSFTDLIVKAAARAILDHPIVSGSLQGNEIRIAGEVNIGVAVALEAGLTVPVIRNADRKPIHEISAELKQLTEKARAGTLTNQDLSGGTFTVTNLGAYGVDAFTPIINPGQSAILGVCRIAEKPVVVDGEVVIRSMMNLCLVFDHRVMDGVPAAEYLQRLKELLESPRQLLA